MINKLTAVGVAATLALLLAVTSTFAVPLFSEGHKPDSAKEDKETEEEILPDVSNLVPYGSVGILPFEQLTRSESGANKFIPILKGRLENACKDTEFKEVEVELDEDTPLMGETARELGQEYGLDALLVGSFLIEVVGGLYPSKTNNTPVGSISIECRVIDCNSGWSRGKVLMTWEKNKIYPQSIRSQKELEGRLMRDGVDDLIKMLLERGYLSFEETDKSVSDEATEEDSTTGSGDGESTD